MPFTPKLTDDQVREIRHSQASARALAERYGVTHPTILNVRERRTYNHVPDETIGPFYDQPNNEFVTADALEFMATLPDGYCETVVTSAPFGSAISPGPGSSSQQRYGGGYRRNDWMSYPEKVDWQRNAIHECIRVAGIGGVVLYHHKPGTSTYGPFDPMHELIEGFPLNRIIIWNHQGRGLSQRSSRTKQAYLTYDVIFMFTGRYWSMPEGSLELALEWGDVWDIPFSRRHESPFWFSDELADRCVALGRGRVLDPLAGHGTTVLAAIRAGRDWLACDIEPSFREAFEARRSMQEQYGYPF